MLRKSNCKLLICDLDNTLSPHFTRLPNRRVLKFREDFKKNGITFVIASNNSKKRVSGYTKLLKPDAIISFAMKPLKFKIQKLMKRMNFKPEETVIMGDQFVTDI
jgi:predicted HAD superfamily phosphohydrolase YqeG